MLGMTLNLESQAKLTKMLIQDEGYNQFLYKDTRNILTCGYGFNMESDGLYPEECDFILHNRLVKREKQLIKDLPYYNNLNDNVKSVLLNLAYCMGEHGLIGFHNMLAYIQASDWANASRELLDSQFGKDHAN